MGRYEKTGYLNEDFKMFHLITREKKNYEYHYHDFDKILIFLKGNVTYSIEGVSYALKPNDIVFVRAGQIHRPTVHDNSEYERIIFYVSPEYMERYRTQEYDLTQCFRRAAGRDSGVLRAGNTPNAQNALWKSIRELEAAFRDEEYAAGLNRELKFLQFLVQCNRADLAANLNYSEDGACNETVRRIIAYVEEHLTQELSIDQIAGEFYLNRYYLMHLFKEETGDTLGNFIINRRLMLTREQIRKGVPITVACLEAGFHSYSNFSRAYKRFFGETAKASEWN